MTDEVTGSKRGGAWRRIGQLLVLLAVLFGVVALVSLLTRQTTTEEITFPSTPLAAVVADLGAGNFEIRAEDRDDVLVTIVRRSTFIARPNPSVGIDGETLRLVGGCRGIVFTFSCGTSFEVVVPRGLEVSIDVDTSAGNTDIVGMDGTIDASISAGNITVVDFRGTMASLTVAAGTVTFSSVTPPERLTASAQAGNVRITVPDDVYRVDTRTSAGNATVTVRTDPASARLISAETSAGTIEITVP